jgi:Nucleotidyl transferase AbiEii toxin, Type IV TA system
LTSLDERGRAVISLLDRWPWDRRGVVIGGYAILAYGPPRYSDDIDIVIPNAAASRVRAWLKAEGFTRTERSVPNPENFEGEVERYGRGPVAPDLLAGAVRDRDAKIDLPEKWISKNPRRERLVTLSARTAGEIPVARPEALWALKLQAGRPRDISDLCAISDLPFDPNEVASVFRGLLTDSLVAKLVSVRSGLNARKIYVDSLSRRQLGSPSDPANIRRGERFVSTVDKIVTPLQAAWESAPS